MSPRSSVYGMNVNEYRCLRQTTHDSSGVLQDEHIDLWCPGLPATFTKRTMKKVIKQTTYCDVHAYRELSTSEGFGSIPTHGKLARPQSLLC